MGVAKQKKSGAKNILALLWRGLAKSLGRAVRYLGRGARDLDEAQRRDGVGLLLVIVAIVTAAGVWWHLDNFLGHLMVAVFNGLLGQWGFFIPLFFGFFAWRTLRKQIGRAHV